ncbi:MAG: hypothetical protein C0524_02325 [Rhodobacter sp.]|nr:hypothetical protein [Rhodobacter sp.]
MKPTFALDLTRDAIAILHRTPKGWLSIGETPFDAPDLDEALDYLRRTALGLSPMGMATKIILPASQILYTEIHAPGPSREDKRNQIAAGLEGLTPYAVEDLVFDWSGKGATVKVAVVARETLDEAEAFAVTHRLNPVSFVAVPEEGTFVGEAWFGPTAAATGTLAPGERVERDRDAVTILHRELPAGAAPAETGAATDAGKEADKAAAEAEELLPGLEEVLSAEADVEADATAAAEASAPEPLTPRLEDQGDTLPGGQAPEPEDKPDLGAETEPSEAEAEVKPEPVAQEPAVADLAAAEVEPWTSTRDIFARSPADKPEADEAPFAHVTDTAAFPEGDDEMPTSRRTLAADLDDDLPPAPPSAALAAFASRRSAVAAPPSGQARPVDRASRSDAADAPSAQAAARLGAPAARTTPAKGFPGSVTAPTIPGTRAKPKVKLPIGEIPRPSLKGPTTVKSPARPGGTFSSSAAPRSRSGIVFLVLVALLLLFLALVGAWASFYLTTARYDAAAPTDLALEAVPGVEDEMLADMQDPEGMTAPLPEAEGAALAADEVAALATESLPVNLGGEADGALPVGSLAEAPTDDPAAAAAEEAALLAEPAPEALPEPAPGTTVATEISAGQPPVEDQDEIFLSAMDAPPPALDALALPAPINTVDALPDTPMPPPAFGTVYQFDANGLLKPTVEGIVSPDGVMLIAGKPPILPPARSEVAAAAAAAAAVLPQTPAAEDTASPTDASLVTADGGAAPDAAPTGIVPAPADPAMAGFRPRPRPPELVPTTEDDARLATDGGSDVATIRPLPRPSSVLAAASASRPGDIADLGAQGASIAAQAEVQLAAAAALEAENPSIVAISMRPAERPRDLSSAVEAAVAAAVRAPEPAPEVIETAAAPALKPEETDELDEPETSIAAPSIPTRANVAEHATYVNAINLSKINLIGTYGTDSRRYALIRQSNGRYKKVKVGDKIDGGTVQAITESEVRYRKGGKLVALKMPKA